MNNVNIGDCIKIIDMVDEPSYKNRIGVVESIDDAGQLHGTWGGCAVREDLDYFVILKSNSLTKMQQ